MIHLVAAIASNGVIGNAGRLPWHNPVDLRRFRDLTIGGMLVMGRRTFESIGRKPLPHRKTIVVSRSKNFFMPDVYNASSVMEALQMGVINSKEVYVVGGAEVYREAIHRADRMHLTHIPVPYDGDTRMPDIDFSKWIVYATEDYPAMEPLVPYAWSIKRYTRRDA